MTHSGIAWILKMRGSSQSSDSAPLAFEGALWQSMASLRLVMTPAVEISEIIYLPVEIFEKVGS